MSALRAGRPAGSLAGAAPRAPAASLRSAAGPLSARWPHFATLADLGSRAGRPDGSLGPAVLIAALLALAAACREPAEPGQTPGANAPPPAGAAPTSTTAAAAACAPPSEEGRFRKVRDLLMKDPEQTERAYKLFPLVNPICTDEKERAQFLCDAAVSAAHPEGGHDAPRVYALDTIEHVAFACSRNELPAALDLLSRAKASIKDTYRFDLLRARLFAAAGRFAEAEEAAQAALNQGSVHAIALTANIQAQRARAEGTGYKPGMLDDAIKTASVEPDHNWQLIDLTAVLSTRAHLLSERAVWEPAEQAKATLAEARTVYQRLSVAPFIATTRSLALDALCFDGPELGDDAPEACLGAATSAGNLGGAHLSGAPLDATKMDLERLRKLEALRAEIEKLPEGRTVMFGVRGDEAELLVWARPAAEVLKLLASRKAAVVVLDRSSSPRASALVDRMLALGGVKPAERIAAGRDTFASPCLTAIVGGRRTPETCPLDKAVQDRLRKLPPFALGVLVGRDLDAEIDDLHLYGLKAVLLSFRRPLTEKAEKAVEVQLKSISDVWIVSTRAAALAGAFKKKQP